MFSFPVVSSHFLASSLSFPNISTESFQVALPQRTPLNCESASLASFNVSWNSSAVIPPDRKMNGRSVEADWSLKCLIASSLV